MDGFLNRNILFGGDYNPDQWDDETLIQDISMLRQAGVNTVTLPVFSWTKMEPEEGKYEFGWLDKILDLLWKNGIHYFLATPTCAQPAWMSKKYPEILPVDISGRKRTHGMRVFFCVNSKIYRRKSAELITRMAEHYKSMPGLIGWHVANEYGTYCYCENCQNKFWSWLENRYGTLENLNKKWNTAFWNKTYMSFEEIMLPTELNDEYRFNPILQLEYTRFMTDSTIACFRNEADILKQETPDLPVFTNISGLIKKLDQFKMAENMDVVGWDNYPAPDSPPSLPAMKHDLMRSLKDGKPYYVMEQSPNQQCWQNYNKVKRPGEIRSIAYQGLAHGADGSLFFQMRQSVAGQEKFHGALIAHSNRTDTRVFQEMSQIGKEFGKLGDAFIGAETRAEVGILMDWSNWWILENSCGPSQDMDYFEELHRYYRPFYQKNISVDFLKVTSDFRKYKIIFVPMLYMLSEDTAKRLSEFVKEGGALIATYMTGYADIYDRCIYGAYPGPLRDCLGIWVEETDALTKDERNHIVIMGEMVCQEKEYSCNFLCDHINVETAEILGVYRDDFYKGTPCLTRNRYGEGCAYYIGTRPEEAFLIELCDYILESDTMVKPVLSSKGEVEITVRYQKEKEIFFLIGHGSKGGTVDLGNKKYRDLINDKVLTGVIKIGQHDVLLIQTV